MEALAQIQADVGIGTRIGGRRGFPAQHDDIAGEFGMTGNDFGNEPGVGLKLCVKAQAITGLRQPCRAASHQPAFGALRQRQVLQRGVKLRLPLVEVEFSGDTQSTGVFR